MQMFCFLPSPRPFRAATPAHRGGGGRRGRHNRYRQDFLNRVSVSRDLRRDPGVSVSADLPPRSAPFSRFPFGALFSPGFVFRGAHRVTSSGGISILIRAVFNLFPARFFPVNYRCARCRGGDLRSYELARLSCHTGLISRFLTSVGSPAPTRTELCGVTSCSGIEFRIGGKCN